MYKKSLYVLMAFACFMSMGSIHLTSNAHPVGKKTLVWEMSLNSQYSPLRTKYTQRELDLLYTVEVENTHKKKSIFYSISGERQYIYDDLGPGKKITVENIKFDNEPLWIACTLGSSDCCGVVGNGRATGTLRLYVQD